MEKLRAEISTLPVNEEDMRRSDLRNLDYLQNVLKESKCCCAVRKTIVLRSNIFSSSTVPFCTCQYPHIDQNNNTAYRWRTRSQVTGIDSKRNSSSL